MKIWILCVLSIGFTQGLPQKLDDWVTLYDEDGYHPNIETRTTGRIENVNWKEMAQEKLKQMKARREIQKPARNVILFVGDGMGVSTETAARVYKSQQQNIPFQESRLGWDDFPYTGLSKTYATDLITPDSANTATAFLCGEKCAEAVLGGNQNVVFENCSSLRGNELKSVLEYSIDEGKYTGIVTSTRLTHATPSAAYAKSPSRNWESDYGMREAVDADDCDDIAAQLIEGEYAQQIRVILGGGRQKFQPNTTIDVEYRNLTGERRDDRDLLQEWMKKKEEMGLQQNKYKQIYGKEEFDNIDTSTVEYLFGIFNPGHMQYESDRHEDELGEPSMAEMVEKAIRILEKSAKGYFLLVEGGRIDHAHHDTNAQRALNDTLALSAAVEKAQEITDEDDTLIVVTADHSHVFTIAGYPNIDTDILYYDPKMEGDDGKKPYTVLNYANGPGWYNHREVNGNEEPRLDLSTVSKDAMTDRDFLQDAGVPIYSETHGGEDVAIHARGPWSHLLVGTHEQNYIAHVMMYASCVGDNTEACEDNTNGSVPVVTSSVWAVMTSLCVFIYFQLRH